VVAEQGVRFDFGGSKSGPKDGHAKQEDETEARHGR
jgi:hypothetical protein